MRCIALIIMMFCMVRLVDAQVYSIGHVTMTFHDPTRTGGFGSSEGPGRQIQSEVYYPANLTGEDVSVASGKFSLVIFGHGYLMPWDVYRNIWESLVPLGYIIVFPRTESDMSPNHNDFAEDLSHCWRSMMEAGSGEDGLFKEKLSGKAAFIGHSMGGGAAVLAASNSESVTTVVAMAPLETNPSAVNAAVNLGCPALILSGSSDKVTVPEIHHHPIYHALPSVCKYFISISGGAHCYFANASWSCDLGEILVSTSIRITRSEQQEIVNEYLIQWLNQYLLEDEQAGMDFRGLLASDSRITYMEACSLSTMPLLSSGKHLVHIFPNPTRHRLFIHNNTGNKFLSYQLSDLSGRIFLQGVSTQELNVLETSDLSVGLYVLNLRSNNNEFHFRVVIHE
jgi:hypothetical protein